MLVMNTAGDIRIDVVPLGTTPARGTVEAIGGGRLLVRSPGLVEVYDQEDFLAGTGAGAVATLRTEEQERAVPAADGGFVVAGVSSVRALGPDGEPRWELPHAPWHGEPARTPPRRSARTGGW
jgi:hypothetical protein